MRVSPPVPLRELQKQQELSSEKAANLCPCGALSFPVGGQESPGSEASRAGHSYRSPAFSLSDKHSVNQTVLWRPKLPQVWQQNSKRPGLEASRQGEGHLGKGRLTEG